MITIKDEQLIITINHPCPKELLKDIQNDIIFHSQNELYMEPEENRRYGILELLKHTL